MTSIPTQLPSLTLPDQAGTPTNLKDSLGRFVVIYFYPKALTSGCTRQACDLRDSYDKLNQFNAKIFGVSPDKPQLLTKFQQKERLPFTLLSDADHSLAELFGSWVEKSMYGRTYMGMSRDTFIYSPEGNLIASKRKVKPEEHISYVIDAISNYNIT